jgi:hypothetical protein
MRSIFGSEVVKYESNSEMRWRATRSRRGCILYIAAVSTPMFIISAGSRTSARDYCLLILYVPTFGR